MNKETGGSAFPKDSDNFRQVGLTIRDYFAAKALQGMLAEQTIKGTPTEFAEMSYAVADAMLEARK